MGAGGALGATGAGGAPGATGATGAGAGVATGLSAVAPSLGAEADGDGVLQSGEGNGRGTAPVVAHPAIDIPARLIIINKARMSSRVHYRRKARQSTDL